MIAFPEMLVEPAKQAGMKVPENIEDWDKEEYPHWYVYLSLQIGTPIPSPDSHWNNARIIADVSDEDIKFLTAMDYIRLGFEHGFPIP